MNRALTIMLIFMSLSSISQEKVFKGIIFDHYTHDRIKDVTVTPYFNNNKVVSDYNGKIEITLDRKYRDTLVFNHHRYYPFVKRVSAASNLKLNFIELVPRSFNIDTICYVAYKENRLLSGEIIDTYRSEPLKGAVISLENKQVITYSNKEGVFKVAVPRSAKKIFISHADFKTKTIPIKYEKNM